VAREITDRCDAADGLVDGIVAETALCRIDPRRLACPAGGEGCLCAAQAQALAEVMAGPVNRDGGRCTSPGPGTRASPTPAGAPGRWARPRRVRAQRATRDADVGRAGLRVRNPARPHADGARTSTSNATRCACSAFHRVYGTADDVLLKGFQQRGGKLLLVHGMADPIFSAWRRWTTSSGSSPPRRRRGARFVRTFLVPGMNHCAGGPATDAFDGLSAIVDWVEQGRPRAPAGARHHRAAGHRAAAVPLPEDRALQGRRHRQRRQLRVPLIALQVDGRSLDIECQWVEPAAGTGGAPPVVFLHEGLGSVSMWRDFPQQCCNAGPARAGVLAARLRPLDAAACRRALGPRLHAVPGRRRCCRALLAAGIDGDYSCSATATAAASR
jgi:pimeloyl-ACP methyl ester carboxylesterase